MPDMISESMIGKALLDFEIFEFQNSPAKPIGAVKSNPEQSETLLLVQQGRRETAEGSEESNKDCSRAGWILL